MKTVILPLLVMASLTGPAFAQAAPPPMPAAVAARAPVPPPLSVEPQFERSSIAIPGVENAAQGRRVREQLVAFEAELAASEPRSARQVQLAATLALNYARIGDMDKAMAAARIAAASVDAMWKDDPQGAAAVYSAIAMLHGHGGHLLDAERVAWEGQMQWRALFPAGPQQSKIDYADGSLFLSLVRVERQNEFLRKCQTGEAGSRRARAWLKEKQAQEAAVQAAGSNREPISPIRFNWSSLSRAAPRCSAVSFRILLSPHGEVLSADIVSAVGTKEFEGQVRRELLDSLFKKSPVDEDELIIFTVNLFYE